MMKVYDATTSFKDILNVAGIYCEYEYDDVIESYDKTGNRYIVPFSCDKVVSAIDGNETDVEDVVRRNQEFYADNGISRYYWQLVYVFRDKLM